MKLEIKFMSDYRRDILSRRVSLDDLLWQKHHFEGFANTLIKMDREGIPFDQTTMNGIFDMIMLCLDTYVYNKDGQILIPDRLYDMVCNVWKSRGGEIPTTADSITLSTTWGYAKHEAPYMVGTISRKIYSVDELEAYLEKLILCGNTHLYYAPKFDGVSAVVYVDGGKITKALTRADGVDGQNITPLITRCNMAKRLFGTKTPDGYYKCEICVSQEDFETLKSIKTYANRRSATAAIVSNPSNIEFAEYLTPIPLAWTDFEGKRVKYLAKDFVSDIAINTRDFRVEYVYETIERIFKVIRDPEYAFRTDGVVIFPVTRDHDAPNTADLMASCLAYKFNTQEAITQIESVYMSVGRTGLAKPMAKVKPCDLNETICTDISLGSMDIFTSMNLHRNEDVIVYAAGDVIPQMRLPDLRNYPRNSPRLRVSLVCPYCNGSLRYKNDKTTGNMHCVNPSCPRVVSGRITTFLDKLDIAEGYRDESWGALVDNRIIRDIGDLFTLEQSEERIANVLGPKNATNLLKGLQELRTKPFEISQVIGACSIPLVGVRMCKLIFGDKSLSHIIQCRRKDDLEMSLLQIPGIGIGYAKSFTDWVFANRQLIDTFVKEMNIVETRMSYGNVVFTGFRSKEYTELFAATGFPVVGGINADTVAVVCVGDGNSGTAMKAKRRNLPLIQFSDIDGLYKLLKKESDDLDRIPGCYEALDIIQFIHRKLM